MRKFRLPPCVPNDVLTCGIEWQPRLISRHSYNRLRRHCESIGKIIAADWLADAKLRAARIAVLVAADEKESHRQEIQKAEQERLAKWQAADAAETEKALKQIQALIAPALTRAIDEARRKRRHGANAIKRERKRLEAAGRELARAKMIAFKRRTR